MARFLIIAVLLIPTLVGAQENAELEVKEGAVQAEKVVEKPLRRRGSFLIRNKPPLPAPDFRGDLGRRRSQELRLHFKRLAEFDVFEKLGKKHKEAKLSKRVEQLRRYEMVRHRKAMKDLRDAAIYTQTVGIP